MEEAIKVIAASWIVLIVFVGIASPIIVLIICLFYYLKKRLEHTQIMAAIEKGAPLSELRLAKETVRRKGPAWIKSIVVGIALIFISLPFLVMSLEPLICRGDVDDEGLVPFGVLFGIGLAFFIRGLLLRKTWRQSPPSSQTNAGQTKTPARMPAPKNLQQTNE